MAVGDPYFNSVVLLLHANTAYPFVDSSSHANTVATYPADIDVPFDTSIKKFGAGSARFPFGTSTLVVLDSPLFDFSSGDWTIDVQVYPTSAHAGARRPIIRKSVLGSGPFPYVLEIDSGGHLQANGTDAANTQVYSIDGGDMSAYYDTWVYLSLSRSGSTFTLRINGAIVGTDTSASALDDTATDLMIGGWESVGNNLGGNIDELRMTKGVARYTGPSALQTEAWPDFFEAAPSTSPKWVQFGRAIRLPHVLGGRGKFQHEKQALQTFITEARTNKVFAKYISNASRGDSNIRVDITHPSVSTQPRDATTFTETVQ